MREYMGGIGRKNEPDNETKKVDDKAKKPPPPPQADDDDYEEGDIATPSATATATTTSLCRSHHVVIARCALPITVTLRARETFRAVTPGKTRGAKAAMQRRSWTISGFCR
jgi:hypothetical protein